MKKLRFWTHPITLGIYTFILILIISIVLMALYPHKPDKTGKKQVIQVKQQLPTPKFKPGDFVQKKFSNDDQKFIVVGKYWGHYTCSKTKLSDDHFWIYIIRSKNEAQHERGEIELEKSDGW